VDLLKWVDEGGPSELSFGPATQNTTTALAYSQKMRPLLQPHAVLVEFISTEREAQAIIEGDDEHIVRVGGQVKVCRSFPLVREGKPKILCLRDIFPKNKTTSGELDVTGSSQQYQLIHHEFAGLAGVESNDGPSSDYHLSSQLTDFLVPEVVLRLSVKKRKTVSAGRPVTCEHRFDRKCQADNFEGSYELLEEPGKPRNSDTVKCTPNLYIAYAGATVGIGPELHDMTEYGNFTPLRETREIYGQEEDHETWVDAKVNWIALVKKSKGDLPANQTFFGLFPRYSYIRWALMPTRSGSLRVKQFHANALMSDYYIVSSCLYRRR
jgi:hypothetical protein